MLGQEKLGSQTRKPGIEIADEYLVKLEQVLRQSHDFSLGSYRESYIRRRIGARIRSLRIETLPAYLEFLAHNPGEEERLIDALTVSVTSFFRDRETFEILSREVAPALLRFALAGKSGLKVWSAGCCTGEEAYSLAIMFLELYAEEAGKAGLRIWATDIDQAAIKCSQQGVYSKDRLENLHPGLIGKYFQRQGENYQVRPAVRKLVSFKRENLLQGRSGFEGMDLVMCRNLLIYLEPEEQGRMLEGFDRSLRPGGFLVLGKSEFLSEPYRSGYESVSVAERIYRKPFRSSAREQAGGKR